MKEIESLKILADLPYRTLLIAQIPFFLIEVRGFYRPEIKKINFFTKTINFILRKILYFS